MNDLLATRSDEDRNQPRTPASIREALNALRALKCLSTSALILLAGLAMPMAAQAQAAPTATLPGHVLGILPKATHLARGPESDNDIVTAEVVLRLSDEAGFKAFSAGLEDPNSPDYHRPIQPSEFAARFGPTQEAYDAVRDYLEKSGLTLVVGSNNRRTLTMRGTRAQTEKAFNAQIDDYQLNNRKFHAIATDPSLPASIAPLILGVGGLSNLARWQPAFAPAPATPASIATAYGANLTAAGLTNSGGLPPGLDGSGQTIGIIALEDFNPTDISSFLSQAHLPSDLINNVHKVDVDGGPSDPPGGVEAVLDIDSVLGIAPGANIQVYGGPYSGEASDFYTLINFAIDNVGFGGTLTNSYYMCENDIAASDATSMDSLLQSAAASGITLFSASGDSGSSCKDGETFIPDTIPYPSDAPHAVAVGGTTLNVHSDNTYDTESWWDDSTGSGGFGNSVYTNALGSTTILRSVPDVAFDASGFAGIDICLFTLTPNCQPFAGTSMAAPMWAGIWSLVGQANIDGGHLPFSAANGYLTTIPGVFHSPSSMTGTGNDWVHLGMGTPKVPDLVATAAPHAEVIGITPNSGTAAGGTKVTVSGLGFLGVNKVTFGGVDATHLTIFSDSLLTVESPVAPSATADVQVETPSGTSAKSSGDVFNYVPEITGVTPHEGPLTGGNTVTVTGVGLSSKHGFQYSFGGSFATGVSCSSSASCTLVVPMHGLGTVNLSIQTPFGDSPKSVPYTYGAPSISSFSPAIGPTTGGLVIGVSGANLASSMTVEFGTTAVTKGIDCVDPTFCWVTNPAVSAPESVRLTAIVDDVSSTPSAGQFTFEVFPTVTGINPSQANAGSVVTLTGTGFSTISGQTTFNFFGTNVAGTCSSTIQCTATVPFEPDGSAHSTAVTVTVNGNTSLDYVVFSYAGKPTPPPCKGTTCS